MRRIRRAIEFAKEAHKGQLRKYTHEPYIVHPISVALLVHDTMDHVDYDDDMVIAALLHDVLEDTNRTYNDIEREFGTNVAVMVEHLTDISKPEDGNRATRKQIDLLHTASASPKAKSVKLADLIDNHKSITQYDPDFAKVYMHEMESLLDVLGDGNKRLFHMARSLVLEYHKNRCLT